MTNVNRPKALLFDIGGVCVVSPFQAILDYEIANNIPVGWINYAIQNTSPNGAWHRIERGEVKVDADFFADFNRDFQHQHLWEAFHEKLKNQNPQTSTRSSTIPSAHLPLPKVNAEFLFWEMMRMAQEPDPYMYPALKRLKESGQFILGALSNTTILPEGHPYNNGATNVVKKIFDFFISSAHCGLRKPDPRIYELALKNMSEIARERGIHDLGPEDIVFLDDIGINLKSAKNAGMKTIKVNLGKTDDAVRQLEQYTGLELLADANRSRL